MCDTMVALGKSTGDNRVLMAKNSDRHPNEPHLLIYQPRQSHPANTRVRCTYLEIDQAELTHAVLLLKPSWIWGAEMGANEYGLNIGNEAVFTREPVAGMGLTGMDMIRLALERCRTSEEALDFMIELLDRYGQGGNCGYGHRFLYHNSFLIADPQSTWVLETAGKYWAAARVQTTKAISNCLTLENDFDRAHPQLVEHAIQKGWCRSARDFSFARCYTNPLITRFSGSAQRLACSLETLASPREAIDESSLMAVLRSHHAADTQAGNLQQASVRSVCMHAGGLVGDHTTGSYVAALSPQQCTYWVTGSSTPCLSIFKPLDFTAAAELLPNEAQSGQAAEYWYQREQLHRLALQGRLPHMDEYLKQRDNLEQRWLAGLSVLPEGLERQNFIRRAWQEESALIAHTLAQVKPEGRSTGNWRYRTYWRRQTKALYKEQKHPRLFSK